MKLFLKATNITLRPSTFEDCVSFALWEAKEYVRKFFTMNDSRNYKEISDEFLQRVADSTKFQLTIVHNGTSKPIGRIYLSSFNRHEDSIDITRIYIGEEDYLKRGFGREAILTLLDYFFNTLKLERVTIDFFEENQRAHNLYNSLGFISEGVLRHVAKKNNFYVNLHLMSMLREEYTLKHTSLGDCRQS